MIAHERPLRFITFALSALATPLCIALTVVSVEARGYYFYHRRGVTAWCFGYVPLALTAAASALALAHHRRHGRMPSFKYASLDLFAGIWYLAVLIAIWAREIRALHTGGFGLLAGYTTAPMIVNM